MKTVTKASAGTGLVIEATPNTVYQLRMADDGPQYADNALRVSTGTTVEAIASKVREDMTLRYNPVETNY